MADIKRLLNKKGWTGRELGIIEITSMATAFRNALAGKPAKPLVEENEFRRMLDSLTDRHQANIYRGYLSIHDFLSIFYNVARANEQQAQLQFKSISAYIIEAEIAETAYRYVEQLPAIMTQKQYDETKAARIEAYFKDAEDGTELYSNIFNLIDRAIAYYLRKLQTEPEKPNPLKAIRKKYIAQPVKSKLILDRYNEVMNEGYYTIEDGSGRRSDQMSLEEWQEAITTPKMQEALTQMRATDGNGTDYTRAIAERRLIDKAKVIFNGGTEEEADKEQLKKDVELGLAMPVKWHTYTEPPTDLTKWDIIEQELLLEFYPFSFDGEDAYTDDNFLASMEDFYNEFKELVDFVLQDMDKKYFSGDKIQASKLPLKEWLSTLISWRRLYELDFYGERAEAESDIQVFNGNKRALFNGVAIVRPSDILNKSRYIDDNGYFVEPEIEITLDRFSLEAFFPEAEEYAERIEEIENGREALLDSYYFLKGYNLALDLIAEYYDIPAIDVFKVDIEGIEVKIDAINEMTPIIYRNIKDTYYEDEELKEKKLKVLQDIFPEIDYKSITIPEENIEALKESFKDFKAFKDRETLANLVCYRPHESKGGGE